MALKATEPSVAELADICLMYLANNADQLAEFMNVTGLSAEGLRRGVAQGTLASGLIDYVVQNEPLLLSICGDASLRPDTVMRVWAKLNPAG